MQKFVLCRTVSEGRKVLAGATGEDGGRAIARADANDSLSVLDLVAGNEKTKKPSYPRRANEGKSEH